MDLRLSAQLRILFGNRNVERAIKGRTMLQKLKEYKELIAIIVFFLGGFTWLNTQFPTKSDLKAEIASLNCLLEKYMTLTQLQIRGQEIERQTHELTRRITGILPKENGDTSLPLSPAMKLEFEQLKTDLEARRNDLRSNAGEMEKIRDQLGLQVCRKVSL